MIYEFQSGFRTSYSTDTCLIHLTDYIKGNCDKGLLTGMVLLDLQKAFDTVDHEILLSKLRIMGFDQISVSWFKAYLSGRKQIVNIDNVSSPPNDITCGVPQGSILGPLLFLIYVNDMPAAVNCKLLLYADDSALIVPGTKVNDIQIRLSEELDSIREWLFDNKLSLHLGKTEPILFGTGRKLNNAKFKINCDGVELEGKTSVKYLGIDLDQSLSGTIIAEKVISKINNRLKFLYRNAFTLDLEIKKHLVSALIQCHFDYACSSWYSGLTKFFKLKFQTLQNKITRFMLKLPPRSHIGLFELRSVGFLPVETRVEQLKLSHMLNIINNRAPNYLCNFVRPSEQRPTTRRSSRNSVSAPSFRSKLGQSTFKYSAYKAWDALPNDIKLIQSKQNFKFKVKLFLVERLVSQENSDYVFY